MENANTKQWGWKKFAQWIGSLISLLFVTVLGYIIGVKILEPVQLLTYYENLSENLIKTTGESSNQIEIEARTKSNPSRELSSIFQYEILLINSGNVTTPDSFVLRFDFGEYSPIGIKEVASFLTKKSRVLLPNKAFKIGFLNVGDSIQFRGFLISEAKLSKPKIKMRIEIPGWEYKKFEISESDNGKFGGVLLIGVSVLSFVIGVGSTLIIKKITTWYKIRRSQLLSTEELEKLLSKYTKPD